MELKKIATWTGGNAFTGFGGLPAQQFFGTGFNDPVGSFLGAVTAYAIGGYFSPTLKRSTPTTRTAVLWPSGGAVGATAGGSGVMDPQVPDLPSVLPRPVVGWLPGVLDTIIDWGGPSASRPQIQTGGPEVVTDWGTIVGGIASEFIQARYAPQPQFSSSFVDAGPPMTVPSPGLVIDSAGIRTGGGSGSVANAGELCGAGPCGSPRYLTYDCRTGTFSKKRRRRRGRLLTAGDQHDLGVIVAMFGKGAAGQIALAAAVKR